MKIRNQNVKASYKEKIHGANLMRKTEKLRIKFKNINYHLLY